MLQNSNIPISSTSLKAIDCQMLGWKVFLQLYSLLNKHLKLNLLIMYYSSTNTCLTQLGNNNLKNRARNKRENILSLLFKEKSFH